MDAQRPGAVFSRLQENLFLEPAVAKIAHALEALASAPSIREISPQVYEARETYLSLKNSEDIVERECALLELYLRLHAIGGMYSAVEEMTLADTLGNRNIAGGLAPLVIAGAFIRPETVSVDLGAGNGLQGLLMQYLYPHVKTMQIELSSELIHTGQMFQQILGIPEDRLMWIRGDLRHIDFSGADFVYLYRPVRPYGEGNALYRSIAGMLAGMRKPLVVVSVADCLGRFLDERLSTFFHNEHLSIYTTSKSGE